MILRARRSTANHAVVEAEPLVVSRTSDLAQVSKTR